MFIFQKLFDLINWTVTVCYKILSGYRCLEYKYLNSDINFFHNMIPLNIWLNDDISKYKSLHYYKKYNRNLYLNHVLVCLSVIPLMIGSPPWNKLYGNIKSKMSP